MINKKIIAYDEMKDFHKFTHSKTVLAILTRKGTKEDRRIWHEFAVDIEKNNLMS
jgi:hypothetical protein